MKKLVIVAVLAAAGVAGAYYGGLLGKTPDTKTATESSGVVVSITAPGAALTRVTTPANGARTLVS